MLRQFFGFLKLNGPSFLRPILERANEIRKEKVRANIRKNRPDVRVEEILTPLNAHICNSDFIVHAGVGSIGKLEEGPIALLDGFLSAGVDRTCLFPALPFNTMMYEYLDGLDYFFPDKARNCMGVISSLAQKRIESIKSLHPTHCTIAIGPEANIYTQGHHLDESPFGPNSPFHILSERKGKILLLGVGLNSVTNMHVHEEMVLKYLPYEVYLDDIYDVPCKFDTGKEVLVRTRCHSPKLSSVRDCERVRSELIRQGVMEVYKVGASTVSVIDANGMNKCLLHLLLNGKSIYGSVSLTNKQAYGVRSVLETLV